MVLTYLNGWRNNMLHKRTRDICRNARHFRESETLDALRYNRLVSLPDVQVIYDGYDYKILAHKRARNVMDMILVSLRDDYSAYPLYWSASDGSADELSLKPGKGETLAESEDSLQKDTATGRMLKQCIFHNPSGYRVVVREPDGHFRDVTIRVRDYGCDLKKAFGIAGWLSDDIEKALTYRESRHLKNKRTEHTHRKRRRFEAYYANGAEVQEAVAKFFNTSIDNVECYPTEAFAGTVFEVIYNDNTYWVMNEEEANREANASFEATFSGDMISSDSVLRMTAEGCPLSEEGYDRLADLYCDEFGIGDSESYDDDDEDDEYDDDDEDGEYKSYDDVREDTEMLDRYAENFTADELWDNGWLDRDEFMNRLWDNYGYGQELDLDQRNETLEINGVTHCIFLRDGEWDDIPGYERRFRRRNAKPESSRSRRKGR